MRTKLLVCIMTTLLSIGIAHAQSDIVVTKSGIGSGGGVYLGAAVGNTIYDDAGGDDISLSVVGGYSLNENIGFELAWMDFGSSEIKNSVDKAEVSALLVSVVGNLPVSDDVTAFGQIGISRWDYSAGSIDESDTDAFFGLGANYWMNPRVSVRFSYIYVPLDGQADSVNIDETLHTFQVGFIFHP